MKILQIPTHNPKVLEQVRVADIVHVILPHGAVLAGGAPRDWHLGREATDLDFFMPVHLERILEVSMKRLQNIGFIEDYEDISEGSGRSYKEGGDGNIKTVKQFKYKGVVVQVILLFDLRFGLRFENHEISRFTYNHFEGIIQAKEEALRIFQTGTIPEPASKDKEGSEWKYFHKMLERYPFLKVMDISEVELPHRLTQTIEATEHEDATPHVRGFRDQIRDMADRVRPRQLVDWGTPRPEPAPAPPRPVEVNGFIHRGVHPLVDHRDNNNNGRGGPLLFEDIVNDVAPPRMRR